MHHELKSAIDKLLNAGDLSAEQMERTIGAIIDGECGEVEIAALLTALAMKGETAEELAGAARAMRARSARIQTPLSGLLDTCGTGGDKLHTFNISTATAIVVAAMGIPVAKHGNRSVSSSSGSADVLETLGVNINLTPEQAAKCLEEIGICFCFARLFHGAMKHVAPVRAALGFRTIFNLLGPLTNPAGAEYQLLGTNNHRSAERIAGAVQQLGTTRTIIVCGNRQLDEVSLWGETFVYSIEGQQVTRAIWTAAEFGLPECDVAELRVETATQSAAVIRSVLQGEQGAARNIVIANAAAALICAGRATSPQAAAERAAEAIDSHQAAATLDALINWSPE